MKTRIPIISFIRQIASNRMKFFESEKKPVNRHVQRSVAKAIAQFGWNGKTSEIIYAQKILFHLSTIFSSSVERKVIVSGHLNTCILTFEFPKTKKNKRNVNRVVGKCDVWCHIGETQTNQ